MTSNTIKKLDNIGEYNLYILHTHCVYFRFLGTGPNITVVDTPGFKDTEDAEFVDELMNVLGDEVSSQKMNKKFHFLWNVFILHGISIFSINF